MHDVQVGLSGESVVFAWSRSRKEKGRRERESRVGLSCEVQSKTRLRDRAGQDRASRVEVRPGQIE